MYAELWCQQCCFTRTKFVKIPLANPKYVDKMENSRNFFEHIFLNVMAQLLNHVYHQQKKATIQYIMCTYTAWISICNLVQEEVVPIADGITMLVSILHRNNHFVEMVVDIASRSVTVFDGLNVVRHNGDTTLSWGPNAIYILKKAN
jgi:hypothetical protein